MATKRGRIKEEKAMKCGAKRRRLAGSGRRLTYSDLEEELLSCILACRTHMLHVSKNRENEIEGNL